MLLVPAWCISGLLCQLERHSTPYSQGIAMEVGADTAKGVACAQKACLCAHTVRQAHSTAACEKGHAQGLQHSSSSS